MNINDYRDYIQDYNLSMGEIFYKSGDVNLLSTDKNGGYVYKVKDYKVNIKLGKKGVIQQISCSCGNYYYGICSHTAAALMSLETLYRSTVSTQSSPSAQYLIRQYCTAADEQAEIVGMNDKTLHLVPELKLDYDTLEYTLKIGFDKMYVVKDIQQLYAACAKEEVLKYGKNLEFRHSFDLFDTYSRKLLELSYNTYLTVDRMDSKKCFPLYGINMRKFFDINKDCGVTFDGEHFEVVYKNPDIKFALGKTSNGRFTIELASSNIIYYGNAAVTSLIDTDKKIFYICTKKFANTVSPLLTETMHNVIYISRKDMPAFYTAVLKPVIDYAQISGIDKLDKYKPPELNTCLYLDCDEDGNVIAKAEYTYDDKKYGMFYDKSSNPYCDHFGESSCENMLLKYFDISSKQDENPLYIDTNDRIYTLLNEGIPDLSEYMEIFTTERFDHMNVLRPKVRPTVGIRPAGSSMLELEITAEGYSNEELIEMLKAYRRGQKFHRLKDGSFAAIDESSLSEFSEMTQSLNITDKSLLKEKIKVPMFRMLYLDNLSKNTADMKIKRSSEFKKKVQQYNDTLSYSENISIPASLENIMRDYQADGYKWLKTVSSYGFGGILADDMGLGKTLQAIALMLDAKQTSNRHITNIVICPSSLVLNWESEIEKFAPELKALTVYGTVAEREEKFSHIDECDVIITSYSLMTRDFTEYESHEFEFMFIDEAQYIKNKTTQMSKAVKSVNAVHRFALTGTPVENSLAELWSIFDFIMPDYLFNYTYFKKNYETPIVKNHDEKATKSLQKMVSPFILRRLKADVLTELPDKTETVLYTDMEEEQSKVYSANVAEIKKSLNSKSGNEGKDKIKILAMLTRLRQICCDPSLVYENYKGESAKLNQCMELIKNCAQSGHKILLFSQFTSMLDIIAKNLEQEGISYFMLTGSTKSSQRLKMVKEFNSDNTEIFLISLKAGGTGLNLTGADVVIHYDPWWNISAENQASDRAYRIGQKNNVQIYKMITRRTIEEKIRQLQQSKSELADIALSGGESGDIMHMTSEEILSLLE